MFDFTINEMSFYNAIKILPKKLDFEADPNNNLKTLMQKNNYLFRTDPNTNTPGLSSFYY